MDGELLKNVPEIPAVDSEEDSPITEKASPRAGVEKLKEEREQARKDADSAYSRLRDRWVTMAGLALVLLLVSLYFVTVVFFDEGNNVQSLLYLLNSVIMLIIGYVFGAKNAHL